MNDLLQKIDRLERQIQEKENELQLIKDDLEAIRAALETMLEEQQSQNLPEAIEEASPAVEAIAETSAEEASTTEEVEAPSEAPANEEQQHEAIMRTIEEFSKAHAGQPKPGPHAGDTLTLSDRAGTSKLQDLKKAFGINERFLYANELFNGDMSAFTRALEELNHLESLTDAARLMDENLSQKYKWDSENDTVIAFRSTVSRRFA
ncbi:MAG: hypothetical protein HQ500_13120 [Flavobacteriales bacterium]|nr:hypothetical protein [Flavobacteriales bacterium]